MNYKTIGRCTKCQQEIIQYTDSLDSKPFCRACGHQPQTSLREIAPTDTKGLLNE
jgi:rRNA maturation endonuclease Nob1